MRKKLLVLCIVALAIIATPIGSFCEMTPFMGQIQIERPKWTPMASGVIKIAHQETFNISIWKNPADCLLVVLHFQLTEEGRTAVHKLGGSNGNNWIIDDTEIGGMQISVLTTFIYPQSLSEEPNIYKGRGRAINEVVRRLGKLPGARVTRWDPIR
jgi:hypothetical protein